jgi:hypothetical protein
MNNEMLNSEARELSIGELDAVTGGGGDCTGPGIGMGGVGHAIKQVVGAVVSQHDPRYPIAWGVLQEAAFVGGLFHIRTKSAMSPSGT